MPPYSDRVAGPVGGQFYCVSPMESVCVPARVYKKIDLLLLPVSLRCDKLARTDFIIGFSPLTRTSYNVKLVKLHF